MKPGIIVLSGLSDDTFRWISDGWNTLKKPNPGLFDKVEKAVLASKDVPDAVRRLQKAGFMIKMRPKV